MRLVCQLLTPCIPAPHAGSATTRAKGNARMRTLLWLYADLVVHKNNPHSPDVFNKACQTYSQLRGVPPISSFAVAEDHFISGPGKGLAGLDSGMAAPMGISSRVPQETRDKLRLVNSSQRAGEFDEGDYMEDENAVGNAPMVGGDFDFGASAFPLFGIDPNLLHPDLANAWLQAPGLNNFNFNQLQGRQFQLPSFPNQMLMPSIPAPGRGWKGAVPDGVQYDVNEEQEGYEGSDPGGDSQGGGRDRDRRRPQRYREEGETGAAASRSVRPAANGNNDDAANMLLALADAANSILDEDDGSGAAARDAPSRKRRHSEVAANNQRRSSAGAGGSLNAIPPNTQMQLSSLQLPLDNPEKLSLAQLAQEAALINAYGANLGQQTGGADHNLLWQKLEQTLARPTAALVKSEELIPNQPLKGLSEGGEERRVRATNSSSITTAEPLRGLNGVPRLSSNGEAYPNEEGEDRGEGATKSPTSCTRAESDAPGNAAAGARLTPPLSSSAAAPPTATATMEDCVVVTLGKLATDPTLSAQERVQLIGSYMKAVQSFVKISVDNQ